MTFDPNADYTATGAAAGSNITDDPATPTAGLFGVSQAVSTVPVTLKRGTGSAAMADAADGSGEVAAYPTRGATADYAPPTLAPYESVLKMFYSLDPNARGSLQQQMFNAGLYPSSYYTAKNPDTIVAGAIDDDSYKAWAKVVQTAARSEKTPAEVLADTIAGRNKAGVTGSGGGGGGGSAAVRAPFSPVVTNPLDIRDTAQLTAKKTLGRHFTKEELDKFVATFQGMETGAQATNYNATAAGGSTTAAPSIDAAAANAARTAAPVEAGAHDLAGVYSDFLSILKGQ